jgi:hypothetical protein
VAEGIEEQSQANLLASQGCGVRVVQDVDSGKQEREAVLDLRVN